MRILIRDAETGRFEGEGGMWTCAGHEAFGYDSIEEAGARALNCSERDLEVVLEYDDDPPTQLALNPVYCVRPLQTGFFCLPTVARAA